MDVPRDRRYTAEDLWALEAGDAVVIGITDFAQDQLGQIVYVDLPPAGAHLDAGAAFGEIESTKTVADLITPLGGDVVEVNSSLQDDPELANRDPYGDGWLVRLTTTDGAVEALLDADTYVQLRDG